MAYEKQETIVPQEETSIFFEKQLRIWILEQARK